MNIVIAIIVFSILILIHEFGHYILAKKNGICVTEFSLGMGPRLFSFTKGETRYSVKLLPLGGSCMMLGEDEDSDNERSFNKKSVWARISVIAAGPIFNFLLAFVLAIIVIGFVGYDPPRVTNVETDSPAYEAGLREGDIIKKMNSNTIHFGKEIFLETYIHPVSKKSMEVTYERNGKTYTINVSPKSDKKYLTGIRYYSTDTPATITDVMEDSAMEKAGAQTGDIITEINGTKINSGEELNDYMADADMTQSFSMKLQRNSKTIDITVTPTMTDYYTLGFDYNMTREKTSAFGVLKNSFYELGYEIEVVFKSLGMLVTGKVSANDVSGPVGIVDIIGDTYTQSKSEGVLLTILSLANLTIMLSANLGVMNLLPIPALDGGRLLFLFVEAVRRKPIAREKEGFVHFIGMVALMILMVLIIFNDIRKL